MRKRKKQVPASAAKPRLSQAARREATRKRILEATLDCLARHGYAATGVAQVVARARVSRGAWAHHFPSMDALIREAAEYLMGKVYERLDALLRELGKARGGAREALLLAWREFFASEVNEIYLELLIASRRDARLATTLGSLSKAIERNLGGASGTYFKARPRAVMDAAELMLLNRWLMRGLALDAPLLPKAVIEQHLEAWCALVETQMQVR